MELEDQVFSQGTFETDGYFEHIKGFEDAIEKFVQLHKDNIYIK